MLFVCSLAFLVVLVSLSVPMQVIDWKDSSLKWPVMCWWERYTLLTHPYGVHSKASVLLSSCFPPSARKAKTCIAAEVNIWGHKIWKFWWNWSKCSS